MLRTTSIFRRDGVFVSLDASRRISKNPPNKMVITINTTVSRKIRTLASPDIIEYNPQPDPNIRPAISIIPIVAPMTPYSLSSLILLIPCLLAPSLDLFSQIMVERSRLPLRRWCAVNVAFYCLPRHLPS